MNTENFDDGLTRVAEKGKFKAMNEKFILDACCGGKRMKETELKKEIKEKWKNAWLIKKESKCWWEKIVDESFQAGKLAEREKFIQDEILFLQDCITNLRNRMGKYVLVEMMTDKIKYNEELLSKIQSPHQANPKCQIGNLVETDEDTKIQKIVGEKG